MISWRGMWRGKQFHPSKRALWVGTLLVLTLAASFVCHRIHESRFLEAQRAYSEDRLADAAAHIESCLAFQGNFLIGYWPWTQLPPVPEDVLLLGSRIERMRWNYDKAKGYLDECYKRIGRTNAVRVERDLLRVQQGHLREMEGDLWLQIGEDNPEAPLILETLADAYMKAMMLYRARESLDRWLRLEPTNVRALAWHAWVLEAFQNREGALTDYLKVLELAPGNFQARLRLAQILLEESSVQEAAKHIKELLATRPKDAKVQLLVAKLLMLQGNLDEAQGLLDASLTADPRDAEALYERGNLANQQGKSVEAEGWFRRALKINGAHVKAHYALCLCLQQRPGKEVEAEAELKRYREMSREARELPKLLRELDGSPDDANLLASVGRVYFRANNEYFARLFLRRANRVNPENREVREMLDALPAKMAEK